MTRALAATMLAVLLLGGATKVDADGRRDAADTSAVRSAEAFIDRYVDEDGRVVRTDQGRDTVSEGQAYAMVLAVAIGDESTFRSVWSWTGAHLQRPNGLLSWRWKAGRVVDSGSASDADLLAAWALSLAGDRFDDDAVRRAGTRLSTAVLDLETVVVDGRRVLVAGPWARHSGEVNPSYLVVPAMSQLWWLTGDSRWADVAASARSMLTELGVDAPHLAPDWSDRGVPAQPASSPSGASPRFGYDAARVPIQLAADCNRAGIEVAAAMWPFFSDRAGDVRAEYDLDGRAIGSSTGATRHPITVLAAAASAHAAGAGTSATRLLDRAARMDDASPTYYGAAWVALARLWLTTDRLGGC